MGGSKTRPDIARLKKHVLRIAGGRRFQFDWVLEQELDKREVCALLALKAEDVISGKRARLVQGQMSRCHDNTAKLVRRTPRLRYCTGLALSGDGIWRVHSWALDFGSKVVFETTELRHKYLGYAFRAGFIPPFARVHDS